MNESSCGKIQRSLTLPQNADCSNAQASMNNGVLTVTMPKIEISKLKKLTIH